MARWVRRSSVLCVVLLVVLPSCVTSPSGPSPSTDCTARGPGVNLVGCDLQGVLFLGLDLHGADFTGADLRGAVFTSPGHLDPGTGDWVLDGNTNLQGAIFDHANLAGSSSRPPARIEFADASNASFKYADLSGFRQDGRCSDPSCASLPNPVSNFDHANFLGANLTGGGITFDTLDATFSDANLTGFGVGPGGSLTGQFTRATLDDLDIDGTLPDTAALSGAFHHAKGNISVGGDTSLTGDFSLTDLTGSSFSIQIGSGGVVSTNFADAVLRDTTWNGTTVSSNFARADLTGAVFTGGDFSGSTSSNTTCPNGVVQSTPCA